MANRFAPVLVLALFVVAGFLTQRIAGNAAAAEPPAAATGPVVVELFTSEGCSSCPPADALLREFDSTGRVEGVEVIALGWHVDYWDHQGWKDRFSSADFTRRQQEYAAAFGSEQVYTPQMVVDGRSELVGSDGKKARTTILKASRSPKAQISLSAKSMGSDMVQFDAQIESFSSKSDVRALLLITERNLQSDVRAGENHGSLLKHSGVVRLAKAAGAATAGRPGSLTVTVRLQRAWKTQDLRAVLLLQDARDRAILGAASIPIPFDANR